VGLVEESFQRRDRRADGGRGSGAGFGDFRGLGLGV
jgi:hypothetical protein